MFNKIRTRPTNVLNRIQTINYILLVFLTGGGGILTIFTAMLALFRYMLCFVIFISSTLITLTILIVTAVYAEKIRKEKKRRHSLERKDNNRT